MSANVMRDATHGANVVNGESECGATEGDTSENVPFESLESMSAKVVQLARGGKQDEALEYAVNYANRAHKKHGGAHSTYINGLATVAALVDAKGEQRTARQLLDEAEQLQEDLEVHEVAEAIREDARLGDSDDSLSCSDRSNARGGIFADKSHYLGTIDGAPERVVDEEELEREHGESAERSRLESGTDSDDSDNSLYSLGSVDEAKCINELTQKVEALKAQGKYEEAAKLLSEGEARLLEEVKVSPIGVAALHTLWGSLLELLGETDMSKDLYAQAAELLEMQASDTDESDGDDEDECTDQDNFDEGNASIYNNEYRHGGEAFIRRDSLTPTEETTAQDDVSSTTAAPKEVVARTTSHSLTTASTMDAENDLIGAESRTPQAPSAPPHLERRPSSARHLVQIDLSQSSSKTARRKPMPVDVPPRALPEARTTSSPQGRSAASTPGSAVAPRSTRQRDAVSATGAPHALTARAPSTALTAPAPRRVGGGFGGGNFVLAATVKPKKATPTATAAVDAPDSAATRVNVPDRTETREDVPNSGDAKDVVTYGTIAPAVRICDHYIGSNRADEAVTLLQTLLDVIGDSPLKNTDVHVSVFEKYCKVQKMVGGLDCALDALMAADEILEDRAVAKSANGASGTTESADKDVARRASLYGAMGEVCLDGRDFKRAQEFLEKSLDFFSTTSTKSHALVDIQRRKTLISLAQCFVKQGKHVLAEEAFVQAYDGHESSSDDEDTKSERHAAIGDADDVVHRETEEIKV